MNKPELIKKIISKKEFSQLPEDDINLAFEKSNKSSYTDEEKIKKTRDLLRRVYTGVISNKLLNPRDKAPEWFLRKHLSTRERLRNYREIYSRILNSLPKELSIIDLGAGVNGFSYGFFKEMGYNVNYVAVESIGQLVDLINSYFKKEKIKGRAFHMSLFNLERVIDLIKKQKKPRVVFLFKVIDSLESLKKDYSKELVTAISKNADRIILSFSTESFIKRTKFRVSRKWLVDFIKNKFRIIDDFELKGERYILFGKNL